MFLTQRCWEGRLHGWTFEKENGRCSCSSVWKGQIEHTSEGTPSGGVSHADGSCQPLRAWKNVTAVGHGGEVCVILSEAGCFLMSICHGSLIIHRITDEKAQSQGAIFALCPNSYSLTSKPSAAHVSVEMIFECTVSIFNVHLFSQ